MSKAKVSFEIVLPDGERFHDIGGWMRADPGDPHPYIVVPADAVIEYSYEDGLYGDSRGSSLLWKVIDGTWYKLFDGSWQEEAEDPRNEYPVIRVSNLPTKFEV